jgi:curved DNA-binding protein CbpA
MLQAEWSAIKKAWYKRALQDHPDKGGDPVFSPLFAHIPP